ncbi:MAG TPA: hypothetical protein P5526_14025, partial [Anaerolineae bacterium]|nr:hypothetical protein [Anaerolineae bacterium]
AESTEFITPLIYPTRISTSSPAVLIPRTAIIIFLLTHLIHSDTHLILFQTHLILFPTHIFVELSYKAVGRTHISVGLS